jgi:hypothetical protein
VASATILLSLTHEEATALQDVLYRVAGAPKTTRRKHIQKISDALDAAGASYTATHDTHGSITFS